MRELSKWGLVAIATAAVVAGLLAIGGPQTARETRRDAERLDDLDDIRSFVECVARATDQKIPESLQGHDICDWEVPYSDPYSKEPYEYVKLSDTAYKLCAPFDNPQRLVDRLSLPLDVESGCITWTFRP